MLCQNEIAVSCKNHSKHMNTLYGEIYGILVCSKIAYGNHYALNGWGNRPETKRWC
jgi:hypothetical protein